MKLKTAKTIFKSKTFWLNLVAALLALGDQLAGTGLIPLEYLTPAMAILNIVLRLITHQPVTIGTPPMSLPDAVKLSPPESPKKRTGIDIERL